MSTILKALRRLEREKSERSDRSLREAVTSASPPPRRRRRHWLAAAGVLVGALAIAAVLFTMLPARDEAEREGPVEIAAEPQKAPPARPAARRRRSSARQPSTPARDSDRTARAAAPGARVPPRGEPAAPPGLPPEALSSDVEVVERIRPARPADLPRAPAPAVEPLRPASESAQSLAGSESDWREAEPPPETRSPASADAEERVRVAAAAPAAPRAEPQPKPASRAAAPAPILRPPVPGVYVERTIWHPLAERRVAVVEVEGSEGTLELHEGDVVGPLVVGKIEPSSVFFVHDGVELRRRVGVR